MVPTKNADFSTTWTKLAQRTTKALIGIIFLAAGPAVARETLTAGGGWAAFREQRPLRCFAMAEPVRVSRLPTARAQASLLVRPGGGRSVHVRLSRAVRPGGAVWAVAGGRRHALLARGGDAWTPDAAATEALVAALRTAASFRVIGTAGDGRRFADSYPTAGAATAIDAAALGCVR